MSDNVIRIETEKLDPNPFQPRIEYPRDELEELGRSMLDHGQLQPIMVRPNGDRYQVAVGWRRVLAAKLVGIRDLLCVIRDLSDEQMAITAMVENLQRRDLNPVEEARGFHTLHAKGWTQERVAKELGRGLTRDIVAQRLRLLSFPAELQELVSHDTITPTHAEALARLAENPSLLKEAIAKVLEGKLTSKQTEQLVEKLESTGTDREIDTGDERLKREVILKYVTSPKFMLFVRYIMLNLPREEWEFCPWCWSDSVIYDDSGNTAYVKCKDCGWSLDVATPLVELFDLSGVNAKL